MIIKSTKNAFGGLKFNWNRRLYVWRASFYYNFVSFLLALGTIFINIGILFTFIFHYLLKGFSFFVNYSCSTKSIRTMTLYILIVMIITDFMSTGRWLDRIGFTVKWFPWLIALLMFFWLILLCISTSWIFIYPQHWCSKRWVDEAVSSVVNCRLIYSTDPSCIVDNIDASYNKVRKCNTPDTLESKFFLLFATKTPEDTCSVTNPTKDIDWNQTDLMGCAGYSARKVESYVDLENSSDLYKYTQLFAIIGSVTYVIIVVFFIFVKNVTEFDAMFYQPKDPNESLIFKIIRPFTPWSN